MLVKTQDPRQVLSLEIGDKIEVHGVCSFVYDIPSERENPKPKEGDKKVCITQELTPFTAIVTGLLFKSEGILDSYNEGSSFEEPGYYVRYLNETKKHPCVLFRKTIRSREQTALLSQITKL